MLQNKSLIDFCFDTNKNRLTISRCSKYPEIVYSPSSELVETNFIFWNYTFYLKRLAY